MKRGRERTEVKWNRGRGKRGRERTEVNGKKGTGRVGEEKEEGRSGWKERERKREGRDEGTGQKQVESGWK